MEAFEDYFKSAMRSDNMLLDKITHYIIKRKGLKQGVRGNYSFNVYGGFLN